MSRKNYGRIALLVFAIATLGTIPLTVVFGAGALRVLVAIPFTLVLPGLALTFAAFPPGRLDLSERILFTLGLSLVSVTLGGLVLHLTPWGLRPASWAILLGGIVLGAGGVAIARGYRVRHLLATPTATWRPNGAQAVLYTLAAVILASALALTVRGAQGQSTVGFTQLWIVDQGGTDIPSIQLGVGNQEPATTQFRLQFEVDRRLVRTWSLDLAPGGRWEEAVPLPSELPQTATIEAVLYRAESPNVVYRRVQLQRGRR